MRTINLIVVHCTATPEGRDVTTADIDRQHRQRGFTSIGYHYVIYRDGTLHLGRPVTEVGAHVRGYNRYSIGVAYVGGLASDGRTPKDTRTPEQRQALRNLLARLKSRFAGARICGHRDLSPDLNRDGRIEPSEWLKACPCFDATAEYKDL